MALFNAKVEYALRAVLDLATQRPGVAAQSREIAQRQGIPEAYLDQVLSLLRRQGLVRSIRGAGGGYVLGHPPNEITIARIVHACHGPGVVSDPRRAEVGSARGSCVISALCRRVEGVVQDLLEKTTVHDLLEEQHGLDESQSLMAGI